MARKNMKALMTMLITKEKIFELRLIDNGLKLQYQAGKNVVKYFYSQGYLPSSWTFVLLSIGRLCY